MKFFRKHLLVSSKDYAAMFEIMRNLRGSADTPFCKGLDALASGRVNKGIDLTNLVDAYNSLQKCDDKVPLL